MMLLTVADVGLRALFNRPIQGTYDLIQLGLAASVYLALPAVFLRDEHLVVDAIDQMVGKHTVAVLDLAGACVSLATLAAMGFVMVPLARDMYEMGDVTADLSIPKIVYWLPVLVGVVASALATALYIARWSSRK